MSHGIEEALEHVEGGVNAPATDPQSRPVPARVPVDAEWKVVLTRGVLGHARVKAGTEWHDLVPIVTLKLQEREAEALQGVQGDAVVLREKSGTARVRVAGVWHEGVPIFEARAKGAVTEEVRVRVHEILES